MIRKVCRRLCHAPGVARGADSPALAGEGYEVVVPAVGAAGAGKGVGEDAALQIFAKRLADIGLGGVVVDLPVKLACAGKKDVNVKAFLFVGYSAIYGDAK